MFNTLNQNEKIISEFKTQRYFCFKCNMYFSRKVPLKIDTNTMKKNGYFDCKYCKENFIIELDHENRKFVQNFQLPSYQKPKDEELREEINTDVVVKKKIKLQMNDIYVKDVLMEVFPAAFRRASIERIQAIRNLLNILSQMEETDEFGPSDPKFIQNLKVQKWSKQNFLKYESCAICTDLFKEDDQVLQLDCQHLFHDECLKPWLQKKNTCPNCRVSLPKKSQIIFQNQNRKNTDQKSLLNLNFKKLKKKKLLNQIYINYFGLLVNLQMISFMS